MELRLEKAAVTFDGIRMADSKYHSQIIGEIKIEVNNSQNEMQHLQRELEDQRRVKQFKSEYEQLARGINQFEAQEVIREKIEKLESEMNELEAKSNSEEILRKRKQMHVLVSMIHEFKAEQHYTASRAVEGGQVAQENMMMMIDG